jgi:hypothetical protein
MDVQGTFLNARMSNCPASNQSGRNEQKCRCRNQSGNVIRGPSQVPECSANRLWYRCRNADASGIILDPWQLYFWSLRTHLNRPHFHIVADFCWCSQMSKFLRCASRKFFYFCKSQIRKFLKNSAQLCLLTLNAEIRLWIHFLFTNLNWGILYYIFKRELIVSLDNVSTQAGKMYTLK